MTPKNLADEARDRTREAEKRLKKGEAAEAQRQQNEKKKLKRQMAKLANQLFAKCQEEINKAIDDEGKTSIRFSLGEKDEKTELGLIYLRDHLIKLLEGAGFKARLDEEVNPPIGSDPEVFYTRYYWYLIVSW